MKLNIIRLKTPTRPDVLFENGCDNYIGLEYHGKQVFHDDLTFGQILALIDELQTENNYQKERILEKNKKIEDLKEEIELLKVPQLEKKI